MTKTMPRFLLLLAMVATTNVLAFTVKSLGSPSVSSLSSAPVDRQSTVSTARKISVAKPKVSTPKEEASSTSSSNTEEVESWDASQWNPSMATYKTEDRFLSPEMVHPRQRTGTSPPPVGSSSVRSTSTTTTSFHATAEPPQVYPVDAVDRNFSPSSLNPMNRPLLGIYSDEGVGYEHGGPRAFSLRAYSNELRNELGYSVDEKTNGQDFFPPAAFVTSPKKLRSFVVSDPFASMDTQRNELSRKQQDFQELSNGTVQSTQNERLEREDEVTTRTEYFRKRIEKMRQRA